MITISSDYTVAEGEVVNDSFVMDLKLETAGFTFLNQGTIRVTGASSGVRLNASPPTSTDIFTFINEGALEVTGDDTNFTWGLNTGQGQFTKFVFQNTGEIRVRATSKAYGLEFDTVADALVNGLPITNDGILDVASSGARAVAVDLTKGGHGFTNNGSILVASDHGAIVIDSRDLTGGIITNNGSMTAQSAGGPSADPTVVIAIDNYASAVTLSGPSIINNGLMSGDWAIRVSPNTSGNPQVAEWVDNNDTIIGDIDLLNGNDRIDNSGSITGDVFMGDGDDVFDTSEGAYVGAADLGKGADTFIGSVSADNANGGAGNDTLNGGGGNDVLSGGAGFDVLNGNAGNDTLFGHSDAPGTITSEVFQSGFGQLSSAVTTNATHLYVAEQNTGIVWRVDLTTGERNVYLDIPDAELSTGEGRGLLGIARGGSSLFVSFTDAEGDLQVRRYENAGATATANYMKIIEIDMPGIGVNNGGWIGVVSGSPHKLYIATGDGAAPSAAQDPNSFLGKVLVVSPHGLYEPSYLDGFPDDPDRNYTGLEVFASGLRNPRSASFFDGRSLYIGDIGEDHQELNFRPWPPTGTGPNFGWPIMDGSEGTPQPGDPTLTAPIFEYGDGVGSAITAGEFYSGATGFAGRYVFADSASGALYSVLIENGAVIETTRHDDQIVGAMPTGIMDFVRLTDGTLLALGRNGTIWKLTANQGAEDADDVLNGGAGDDYLDGNRGDDQMYGGADNDIYIVAQAGDDVIELADEGTDVVLSSITYTLTANVENLTLTGSAAINGAGNALNNVITGNGAVNWLHGLAGNDLLNGGVGDDHMYGGADNDTYVVERVGDDVVELADEGTDTVLSSVQYTLGANVENLTLTGAAAINGGGNTLNNVITGNGAANTLLGLAGNDVLDGGVGADKMYGAQGDDTYYVDNAGDIAFEAQAGWGTDLVYASITYTLGANIDNLTLTGSSNLRGNGNDIANTIIGNTGVNTLYGYAGNDVLNGGVGADKMYGGEGDDAYYVDNVSEFLFENQVNWGVDTAYATVGYWLGQNIDNLVIQAGAGAIYGRGNEINNAITGNESANSLYGFQGNDVLNGGVGADKMYGQQGDDTYHVDNAADVAFEAQAGWGVDTVYTAVNYELGANLEHLVLTGAALNGRGNSDANTITGNANANRLNGLLGNDTIIGGTGNDVLIGGGGDDAFIFSLGDGDDTINDFAAGGAEDSIDLSAYDGTGVTWTVDQAGQHTVFNFSNGDSITLLYVNSANLVQDGLFGYS